MKIKTVKISNELMDALVKSFFTNRPINDKLTFCPLLEKYGNIELDITYEDLEIYRTEDRISFKSIGNERPYFSLISDNARNDLQVYIHDIEYDENDKIKQICARNLSCRTQYMFNDSELYDFKN